ncbi:unnamed protein product [Sphagnum balticum]
MAEICAVSSYSIGEEGRWAVGYTESSGIQSIPGGCKRSGACRRAARNTEGDGAEDLTVEGGDGWTLGYAFVG